MLRLVIVFSCVFFSACGSSSNNNKESSGTVLFDKIEFLEMENSTLEIEANLIKGAGAMVAVKPLQTIDSGNSFAISGILSAGSSVTLVTNADNKLMGGLEFVFSRKLDEIDGSVKFGNKTVSISDYLKVQDPEELNLILDVHNDESPAHVLIWASTVSEFSEETAIFNSEDAVVIPGNGTGAYWGIKSSQAEIAKLSISEPKFEEE